jgi:hypothetical protein
MLNLIEKVTFYKLRTDTTDRRGKICTILFKKVNNTELPHQVGIHLLSQVISLLSNNYFGHLFTYEDIKQCSEVNSCWIDMDYINLKIPEEESESRAIITVRHKYWSEARASAFKNIIDDLAWLHEWDVDYNVSENG